MPDKSRKFQEFALRSILFRGRHDWYFCYLKSERIAHVLYLLAQSAPEGSLDGLAQRAGTLPGEVCRLAAGEFDAPVILADIMGLLSGVRLATTAGLIHKDNASVLCAEYEQLAERLVQGSHPSPFGSEDFAVPQFTLIEAPPQRHAGSNLAAPRGPHDAASPAHGASLVQKDISDIKDKKQDKGQNTRAATILDVLKKQKSASIKGLAAVITNCSEKTIQRELTHLIERGLVRKTGERRWSVYSLV